MRYCEDFEISDTQNMLTTLDNLVLSTSINPDVVVIYKVYSIFMSLFSWSLCIYFVLLCV